MNLDNVTCNGAPLPPSNAQNSGLNSEANGTNTDGKQKTGQTFFHPIVDPP
jgi:hypothetical protein